MPTYQKPQQIAMLIIRINTSLHQISPLQTLKRGYAVVTDENQQVVQASEQVQAGDTVHCQLYQGKLICTVNDC